MNHIKQVYAALKMDDGQIQICVAEYFNTRFNVINTYSINTDAIDGYRIVDEDNLVNSLKIGFEEVSKKVGSKLEKVIVVLPPIGFTRVPLKVSVIPFNGILRKSDIARAVSNSLKTEVEGNKLVIDAHITKYTINGISTRRYNENEVCDEAILDISLLCMDKDVAYSYVKAVNKAGMEVLDVTLSNYAIAKESVALDNAINQNTVLLDIGNEDTYLTLLSKGKLLSTEVIHFGMNSLSKLVYDKYHLPYNVIERLLKYNVKFDGEYLNDAIYAWNDGNTSYSITSKELSEFIKDPLHEYLDKITIMCKPIIDKGTNFFITGQGSSMESLVKELQVLTNCDCKSYFPDTIGIRNANMSAVYGALFVYRDKALLNEINVNCVNMSEYDKTVDKIEDNIEGESITQKIKNLFEIYKDKGDIQ